MRTTTHPWVVLDVICCVQFMVTVDVTIANVVFPSIHTDPAPERHESWWIVNAYAPSSVASCCPAVALAI